MIGRSGVGVLLLLGLVSMTAPPSGALSAQTDAERRRGEPSIDLPSELSRVLRDYERFWGTGAADELAALFVAEGLIVRDGVWIRGRDRIREAYRNASGPLRLRAIEYAMDGNVGYIVGAYGYGDEAGVEDRGMFVLTLRREAAGTWLIVSDMDRPRG